MGKGVGEALGLLKATGPVGTAPGKQPLGRERRPPHPPGRGWCCWALQGTESTACEKRLASLSPAEPVGPGDVLTALTHREKLLETKLKTKIVLSMIASQVFILTSLNGSSKLRFWKLLASPRSTTKI